MRRKFKPASGQDVQEICEDQQHCTFSALSVSEKGITPEQLRDSTRVLHRCAATLSRVKVKFPGTPETSMSGSGMRAERT